MIFDENVHEQKMEKIRTFDKNRTQILKKVLWGPRPLTRDPLGSSAFYKIDINPIDAVFFLY